MKKHLIVTAVFAAVTSVFAAAASFESAKCVWPEGREAEMNGFCRFRASFDAAEGAKAVLRATAGYDYRARLNGAFAGFGPARSVPGMWRVDEWPLAAKPGRNIVEIDVAGYNCNSFYLTDQTPFLCAEILVDGKVVAATVKDGGFSAETTGRVRRVPRFSYQRPFMEVYRLPHEPERLALAEQPERRWLAREWAYPSFALTKPFRAVSLEKVVYDASIEPKTGRHVVKNRDDYKLFPLDVLEENPYFDIQRLRTVSRGAAPLQENGWFRIGRDEGVVFEGEREAAGFPVFKVRCDEPVDVYLTFDEMLSPDGSVDPFRAETVGTAVWHLGAGEHEIEGFEPVAFKAARILVRGASAALAAPRVRTYESPCADRASFRASDPALSVIFEAAKRSYAANAVDCLTDCPIRERAGWLGDSLFTGRASQWLTGSGMNERLFLGNFALPESFGEPAKFKGLVPAVWPVDFMTEDCFIPNYAMWFAVELEDYVRRTGDRELAARLESRVLGTISYFDRFVNSDGLLEKLEGWVFVEWSKANDLVQDVSYPSNMLFAMALDAAARLYGRDDLAARAAAVRGTVRRQSLTADGWYCDNAVRGADGRLAPSGERTEVCQYYAFFSGVATKERDAALWRRLVEDFGPGRSKWPEVHPANFIFGTVLRLELLSRDGRSAQVLRETRGWFLDMAEKTGTLWEHSDSRASCCHGFASIAAEYLYRDVLGVRRVDAARRVVEVRAPDGVALEWCEGTLPLAGGAACRVRWNRADNGAVRWDCELPEGWRMEEL